MSARIVKLNIGGHKFCTTAATLTKHPDTFFTSLIHGSIPTTKDDEGAYFVDRDGQFFSPILTWLRTNEISIPSNITKEDVIREAVFYSLQPLVDILTVEPIVGEEKVQSLDCPNEIEKYVGDYWTRHENTIITIVKRLNKEGCMNVTLQIIPGHRQDFERPPQLLENGKLGLYMNFTCLHITKYVRVQCLLGTFFKERGFGGYFRPGELLELWWSPSQLRRENDIVHF